MRHLEKPGVMFLLLLLVIPLAGFAVAWVHNSVIIAVHHKDVDIAWSTFYGGALFTVGARHGQ